MNKRAAFGNCSRTSAVCVYYDWAVRGPATGRNPCVTVGLCIPGCTYSIYFCKESMAHGTQQAGDFDDIETKTAQRDIPIPEMFGGLFGRSKDVLYF